VPYTALTAALTSYWSGCAGHARAGLRPEHLIVSEEEERPHAHAPEPERELDVPIQDSAVEHDPGIAYAREPANAMSGVSA